jgi:hypothetical protein
MVQEANRGGDVDASAAYSSAAMAVRRGVRPTPIEVKINDESQRYLAFVHVVTHGRSGDRPIRLRTMVAYQGEKRPEKVLYVSTLVDAGPLDLPTATLDRRPDVQQVAWAAWKDLANRELWVATSGQAGIVEKELLGPCPTSPPTPWCSAPSASSRCSSTASSIGGVTAAARWIRTSGRRSPRGKAA